MFEDKKETPSLIIPRNLPGFIRSKKYSEFISCVYTYCMTFNSMMHKYNNLKKDVEKRMGNELVMLQK